MIDFRGTLSEDSDWNDEMHPTGADFERLAVQLRMHVRAALAPGKQAGIA